ncbi:hypothetical protein Q2T46_03085 [Thermoanaerobacterium sp. CMT5567-10]|uniref:hypothetical protein n=1 Tax=Thermoanaerobacterium sp. CMT5567-10 TaxID=3061989 RepID=UPI0026DEDEFC|nr:hypothetical protein [Thermoanaerobacterium sp. CMT5567-10]WKV09456.1 hypothetical protein Q2T46_03085 [Thermoanaerobacterium sp. CMT5567-10]
MKNNKENNDSLKKFILNFINPSYKMKNKNTYFSYHRRNVYLLIELIFFLIVSGNLYIFLNPPFPFMIIISLLCSVILLLYLMKLEKLLINLKELDKCDIRFNINRKIAEKNKTIKIEILTDIAEESSIQRKIIESEINISSLSSFISTLLGFIIGFFTKNTTNIIFSSSFFIAIFLFITYLYFFSDLIKTSKLYLIELYDYQISYTQRLIKKIEK